ncbi:MAG: DnaJ domain-containing protein [Bacteroidota bacterium]
MTDYYKVLGTAGNAKQEEIETAYRDLASLYHPDHNGGDRSFGQQLARITEAYAAIGEPGTREAYDAELASFNALSQAEQEAAILASQAAQSAYTGYSGAEPVNPLNKPFIMPQKPVSTQAPVQNFSARQPTGGGQNQFSANQNTSWQHGPDGQAHILSFTASNYEPYPDEPVTIAWSTDNADEVTITGLGSVEPNGAQPTILVNMLQQEYLTLSLKARNSKTGSETGQNLMLVNRFYSETKDKMRSQTAYSRYPESSSTAVYLYNTNVFATVNSRLTAMLIDLCLIALVWFIAFAAYSHGSFTLDTNDDSLLFAEMLAITFVYNTLCDYAFNGTPGKTAAKIRVVKAGSFSPLISFRQAVSRNGIMGLNAFFCFGYTLGGTDNTGFGFYVFAILALYAADIILFSTGKQSRALHDRVADTAVVNLKYFGS